MHKTWGESYMDVSTLLGRLLIKKPIRFGNDAAPACPLARTLGLFSLTMLGIGSTVGTGIFVVMSEAVPKAGPAVIVSFIIAGITATLTALCYAELASTMPESGSAYSYSYATLGELPAYAVGWCLVLEYGVSSSAIAVGWGQYLNKFLSGTIGWVIPPAYSLPVEEGGLINLPSVILVAMCGLLLLRGARESATANAVMVVVKLAVLALFIGVALYAFKSENLQPFMTHGVAGVGAAAGTIFFSFIGIDAVTTAADEVKNPRRTMPLAIVLSLVVVTAVYILTATGAVGAQPQSAFVGQEAGLAAILENLTGATWPYILLSAGAIISIFSVTLVTMYGQTRILMSMGRDGMLPRLFSKVKPGGRAPVANTIIVCIFVGTLAAVFPLNVLADLCSLGTLVAFSVVSVAVLIIRRKYPENNSGFRVPFWPFFPLLSLAFCFYLIFSLPLKTFALFAIWLAVAAIVYFLYGYKNSAIKLAGGLSH
jgi:basic amino acid/polyamine antiporter, APA family